MTRFLRNIKNILVYSDSDLLEISFGLALILNPLTQTMHFIHPIWHLMGIASSLFLFLGLGNKKLRMRELALLWGMANLTAINIIEISHDCLEVGYLFQNLVAVFLWWKVSKQRLIYQLRGGDSGHK